MKGIIFGLFGSLVFGLLCIGFTWFLGYAFGPLYDSEAEATRNFKWFLFIFTLSVLAGGLVGYKSAKSSANKDASD